MTLEQLLGIIAALSPVVLAGGGWLVGQRMKEAKITREQAEAERTLAEAKKLLAEADSEEARSLGAVIDAWQTLFASTKKEMDEVQVEMKAMRAENDAIRRELKKYKNGVDVLITQLRRLGHVPEWDPNRNGGK